MKPHQPRIYYYYEEEKEGQEFRNERIVRYTTS